MAHLKKTAMTTIAIAASLSVVLAGCGNSTGGNGSSTGNATGNSTGTTTSGTPVDGGTLTMAMTTKYDDQLIPDMDSSLYTANVVQFAFDSLLSVDKDLNFGPGLVKSWDFSADKKSVTMHLQPNANWSDGQPITSDDVLFTMNYLGSKTYSTTLQGQYQYLVAPLVGSDKLLAGKADDFSKVGGFTKVDDKTFTLHFQTVDAAALYSSIAPIQPIPEHIYSKTPMKDWANASEDKMPTVVSGPYTFTKVNGQDSVEMAANPNYWNGKPHISNLVIKVVNENVLPGLLADGSVQYVPISMGLHLADADKLSKIPNLQVKTGPSNGWDFLGLKLYKPEFKDVKVRQAFEYALDKKTMIQGIEHGLAQPVSGPLPPVSWAAATAADGMNSYDYNVDKANQLLDQAGWKKGSDGMRIDPTTGKAADLHLAYSTGSAIDQEMGQAIQQAFQKVGVKVTIDPPLEWNTFNKKVESDDPSIQMWLMAWSLGTDPDPRGLWVSTDAMNLQRWKDPQNDSLIKDTYNAAAFDKTARKQALVKWQSYVNQQMPVVFLWAPDNIAAWNSKLNIPAKDFSAAAGGLNPQDWWLSK
ncbi:ABC transporter substrate-binding protein [Alicyclobacillus dauci]|uniref:ABC transporter substrate-binding protein n=1 Tax=Alicyclobacillus dauci TaxID=1475485 RepID=A0ABY6Z7V7_9BACL|nr:ABC transporter substrate-binding protein [Alicyclobacillus dauci]WAH38105.1 ABC transporter substrate-binding protein [Alicyclobacillus dauci]